MIVHSSCHDQYFSKFSLRVTSVGYVKRLCTHWNVLLLQLQNYIIYWRFCKGQESDNSTSEFLAHLSRRLTRWAYRMGLEPASIRACVRASVRPCVHTFKHEYLRDQQADYNQILYDASLEWGKGCIGFDADQIRTLVSMATASSHRVIMGKSASARFLDCFWSDPFYTCR